MLLYFKWTQGPDVLQMEDSSSNSWMTWSGVAKAGSILSNPPPLLCPGWFHSCRQGWANPASAWELLQLQSIKGMDVLCCHEPTFPGSSTSKEESQGFLSPCRGGRAESWGERWAQLPWDTALWGSHSQNPHTAAHFWPQHNILAPFRLIYPAAQPAWQADKAAVLMLSERQWWRDGGSSLPWALLRRAGSLELFSDNSSCPSWGHLQAARQPKPLTTGRNRGKWYEGKQIFAITLILAAFLIKRMQSN